MRVCIIFKEKYGIRCIVFCPVIVCISKTLECSEWLVFVELDYCINAAVPGVVHAVYVVRSPLRGSWHGGMSAVVHRICDHHH